MNGNDRRRQGGHGDLFIIVAVGLYLAVTYLIFPSTYTAAAIGFVVATILGPLLFITWWCHHHEHAEDVDLLDLRPRDIDEEYRDLVEGRWSA